MCWLEALCTSNSNSYQLSLRRHPSLYTHHVGNKTRKTRFNFHVKWVIVCIAEYLSLHLIGSWYCARSPCSVCSVVMADNYIYMCKGRRSFDTPCLVEIAVYHPLIPVVYFLAVHYQILCNQCLDIFGRNVASLRFIIAESQHRWREGVLTCALLWRISVLLFTSLPYDYHCVARTSPYSFVNSGKLVFEHFIIPLLVVTVEPLWLPLLCTAEDQSQFVVIGCCATGWKGRPYLLVMVQYLRPLIDRNNFQ